MEALPPAKRSVGKKPTKHVMCFRLVAMASIVSLRTALGFVVVPPPRASPSQRPKGARALPEPALVAGGRRSLAGPPKVPVSPSLLHYQYENGADREAFGAREPGKDEAPPSPSGSASFVVPSKDGGTRHKSNEETEVGGTGDTGAPTGAEPAAEPLATHISDAIKEVLTAPVLPVEDKTLDPNHQHPQQQPQQQQQQQQQHLILPASTVNPKHLGGHRSERTAPAEWKAGHGESDPRGYPKTAAVGSPDTRARRGIDFRKQWRKLRPSQKFRFRLGVAAVALASLWNPLVVRGGSGGLVGGILTGAAATTTATGLGSVLGRWISLRGFQGIAALGRSVAYGWAILVAYPRMLDRRAKERRLKREEEALAQWRQLLRGISGEVVRLKQELSLLEGEIRSFRREILSIRAARIVSDGRPGTTTTTTTALNNNSSSSALPAEHHEAGGRLSVRNESDRVLREAIVHEMNHLTRLRDDTRLALTTARQRWSEVRAKRPIGHSGGKHLSSAFDPLEHEFDAETASSPDYRFERRDHFRDDDLLLRGL